MRFARFESFVVVALPFAVLLSSSGVARAQGPEEAAAASATAEPTDVVLLAPADVRAEWTAALQIELAPRGARVIPGEPPTGETVLLRDAEAQRVALTEGARAAARVESDASGWTLRVIARDAASARATPVASEADARTVALILVSLLDEPVATLATAVPPPPAAWPPAPMPPDATVPSADAVTDTTSAAAPEAEAAADEDVEPPRTGGIRFSGRIGSGGFGLVNDRRFIPGAMLRGGFGLEAGYFEGALLADAGLMLDDLPGQGSEFQPLGRLCVEAGAAFPLDRVLSLHVGGRGCGGLAELRKVDVFDPVFGEPSFAVDQLGGLVSAGGYVALSIGLGPSARLFIRADVEGALLDSSMHFGEVFPVLSTLVSVL
jgi:hypothetical protein